MKQAHLYKIKLSRTARALIVTASISVCLLIAFLFALTISQRRQGSEGAIQLETALRRACVTCYAIEGRYPPSLDYILDHYGVIVDSDTYTVRYDAFAENLLPDITVTRHEEVLS